MIVLTGGAGFIGSCFLRKLNDEGIKDIIVVDHLDESDKWKNLIGKKFIDYIQKDDFINMIGTHKMSRPSHVIHMGACSSTTLTNADHYIRNNYEYSKTLAEWALMQKSVFMYASSAATYGDGSSGYSDKEEAAFDLRPLNMYGYSKYLFDVWILNNKLIDEVTGLKFFNVFGPNEYHKDDMKSVICKAFPRVRDEGKIELFKSYKKDYPNGGQKRDFIYIKDVIEVMYHLFQNPDITGIYNIGTGKARSWEALAKAMFVALGKTPRIEYIDMPEGLRDKYQYFTQADMRRLKNAGCGINFHTLEESIKDYMEYLKDQKYL